MDCVTVYHRIVSTMFEDGLVNAGRLWKVLCSATQVVDDLICRAKDGEHVDWRYHLGEDVYFIIKAPQLTIHIRKHFVPNGEWTLHPTKIGVTLSLYEWKELKKIIPLFKKREPELTIDNV